MAETLEIEVLTESLVLFESEETNSKESMNSAVNIRMSRIDEVQQGTTIQYNTFQFNTIQYNRITPTPNAAAATSQGSLESSNSEGNGSVLQAARAGRWDKVNYSLERGVSATECEDAEECALALAARAGREDAVRRLLRREAMTYTQEVEWGLHSAKTAAVRGRAGEVAMRQAARDGWLDLLVALLDLGVDIDCKDTHDQSALMEAAGRGRIACVKELLRRGADVTIQEEDGWTALHFAANGWLHGVTQTGQEDCVRALLEAGASRTVKSNNGKTPLEVADSEPIRRLLRP